MLHIIIHTYVVFVCHQVHIHIIYILCTCAVQHSEGSSAFTYQFHLVGTESWRQSVPPLPPNIITSGKYKLMRLSINIGSKKALLSLHIMKISTINDSKISISKEKVKERNIASVYSDYKCCNLHCIHTYIYCQV